MYYVLCMYVCIEVYFDFVSEIVYAFTSVLLEKMKITTKKNVKRVVIIVHDLVRIDTQ